MPVLTSLKNRKIFFAAFLLAYAWAPLWAEPEISKGYQVKAVFLFNFTQFVQWPPAVFSGPEEPFCIGILGEDPFDGFLDETVKGEKVNGHPLVIRRFGAIQEVKHCQVLFVSQSEASRLNDIFSALRGKNILAVGETEGFDKNGGVIRFVTEENKIHFRINLEAAKRANLKISSQVLRLAEIVSSGKDRP